MNLYLVNTPYHLLLSVINGGLKADSVIVMLDMTGNLKWFSSDEVSSLFNHQFHYFNLGGRSEIKKFVDKNYFLSKKMALGVVGSINKININTDFSRVYVFNDNIYEIQGVLRSLPESRVTYIEDGSAPYNTHEVVNRLPGWFEKIIFGFGFDSIKVLGTSSFIHDNLFTRPEIARSENRVLPIKQLKVTESTKKDLDKFVNVFDFSGLEKKLTVQVASLYLLPPVVDDKVIACYKRLWDFDDNIKLVKKHPLSKINFKPSGEVIELDAFIPAEAYLLRFKNIKVVYGYPSTTLFFSKYINPDIFVCCVPSGLHVEKDQLSINMELCGINVLEVK